MITHRNLALAFRHADQERVQLPFRVPAVEPWFDPELVQALPVKVPRSELRIVQVERLVLSLRKFLDEPLGDGGLARSYAAREHSEQPPGRHVVKPRAHLFCSRKIEQIPGLEIAAERRTREANVLLRRRVRPPG